MRQIFLVLLVILLATAFVFAEGNGNNNINENENDFQATINVETSVDAIPTLISNQVNSNLTIRERDFEQLRERIHQINSENAEFVQNMNEIRKEYQKQFVEAVSDSNNELKEQLKEVRKEIANSIGQIISDGNEIDFNSFHNLGQQIRIMNNEILVGNDSNQERIQERATIHTQIKNRLISISNKNNVVEIEDGNIIVQTNEEIEINDDGVTVGGNLLGVLPSKIKEKTKLAMKLHLENNDQNKLQYRAQIENTRNLFGLIPMTVQEQARINAETGLVEGYDAPWWAFLATGENALKVDEQIE